MANIIKKITEKLYQEKSSTLPRHEMEQIVGKTIRQFIEEEELAKTVAMADPD